MIIYCCRITSHLTLPLCLPLPFHFSLPPSLSRSPTPSPPLPFPFSPPPPLPLPFLPLSVSHSLSPLPFSPSSLSLSFSSLYSAKNLFTIIMTAASSNAILTFCLEMITDSLDNPLVNCSETIAFIYIYNAYKYLLSVCMYTK